MVIAGRAQRTKPAQCMASFRSPEDDPWRLPLVARYIIDHNRIIQYAVVSADHTDRVEPEHTLIALEALTK
jgi:hypothetical protein